MTLIEKLQKNFPELTILNQEPMSKHTSFRIGGPAQMVFPKSCEELMQVYRVCVTEGVRPLILGAGTNILAPDDGLDTLVICTKDVSQIKDNGNGTLEVDCGVQMSKCACYARDLSLTGLEFAHGIPGTVGGGIYMNAGAYGGEMKQVVTKTLALLPDGSEWMVTGEEHDFSYRHSVFEEKNAVILKTWITLSCGDKNAIAEKMQELAQKRRASQPLDLPSAGSTFKRPAGGYAAAMIDEAGLKGKGVGCAAVSEKHAGFVVNLDGATSADVLATMDQIVNTVYARFGVKLEAEVRVW